MLAGRVTYGKTTGQVITNGETIPLARLQKVMGFVPQDDTVHQDLTVR